MSRGTEVATTPTLRGLEFGCDPLRAAQLAGAGRGFGGGRRGSVWRALDACSALWSGGEEW